MSQQRWAARAIAALIALPVTAGTAGVVAPALGYLPAVGADRLSLEPFVALAATPGIARSALITLATALAATTASLFLTAAIVCAFAGTRTLALVERLLAPVLSIPHAAAALGLVILFAPTGLMLRALSPWLTGLDVPPDIALTKDPYGIALTAALVLKETPFLVLMSLAALPQVRAREGLQVAASLGYGRLAGAAYAVWPLVFRQIRLPVLAVAAFSVSVVDVAVIVGPTQPPPLAVRVTTLLQSPSFDAWLVGSAAAVAVLGVTLVVIAALAAIAAAARVGVTTLRDSGVRFAHDAPARGLVGALALAIGAILFAGLAGLALQSVAGFWRFPSIWPANVTLSAWAAAGSLVTARLFDTLAIAAMATAASLPLAVLLLSAGGRAGAIIYLPLLVPQVAFLFGLNIFAIATGLAPSLALVAAAHALFTLPYVVLALSGPWHALDPRYLALAQTLGVPGWQRFVAVRLAMMLPALLVAAALSVAVSVGLYLPTQLIGGGQIATLTTEAVGAASGGDRRRVAILALCQAALPFLAFALARAVPALLYRRRRGMRAAA